MSNTYKYYDIEDKLFENLNMQDGGLSLNIEDHILKIFSYTPLYGPVNQLIEFRNRIINKGINTIKIFNFKDGNIELNDESGIVQIIVNLIKKLLPFTENYTTEQMINLFSAENLLTTVTQVISAFIPYVCTAELSYEKIKGYLNPTQWNMFANRQTGQSGGVEPISITLAIIIIVAIVCIAIVAIVVIIMFVLSVTIIATIAFVVFGNILLNLIYSLPSIIALFRTKDNDVAEVSKYYLDHYPFDKGFGSMDKVTEQLPSLIGIMGDTANVVGTAAITGVAATGTAALGAVGSVGAVGSAVASTGTNVAGVVGDVALSGGGGFCDIINVLKQNNLVQVEGKKLMEYYKNIKLEDLKGPNVVIRYLLILFLIVSLSRDMIREPLKEGYFKLISSNEISKLIKKISSSNKQDLMNLVEKDLLILQGEMVALQRPLNDVLDNFIVKYQKFQQLIGQSSQQLQEMDQSLDQQGNVQQGGKLDGKLIMRNNKKYKLVY